MQAKSRTLSFILLSFLLGGVAGGFVGASFFGQKGSARLSRAHIMREFTEKVHLHGSQPEVIDSLLEVYKAKLGEIRKSHSEAFRLQRDSLRKEIRKVLSEEQNSLYDQFIREMDERESRFWKEKK
ncbi:MAG: hypothetical protein HYW57_08235 [Ignavibacteriales bacterium]|nr:hypothetical protein [Ignavibacteriales bacterium]